MIPANKTILTINGGSSSIKFSFYKKNPLLKHFLHGEVADINKPVAQLNFENAATGEKGSLHIDNNVADRTAIFLLDWLQKQEGISDNTATGHRIVHGMKHTEPEIISAALLNELKTISAYDPDHLPAEIKLIELFQDRFPAMKQVACFDTSFHTTMPAVAKQLAIPQKFTEKGIQRYGFHGLSYDYLIRELKRVAGETAANGNVIIAHLGSGASLAAIKNGKSIDTSMGFTPASGIPMSTRSGDLDPGVAWYIMQSQKFTPEQFSHLVNHEAGLLGVSGTSADMKELLAIQHNDVHAAAAIELFCYQAKKWIGSFAAALSGVETLVFAGGIGERSSEIRQRICEGLGFLGIELDDNNNKNNEPVISLPTGRVCVRVMKTNEELMIAQLVCNLLGY